MEWAVRTADILEISLMRAQANGEIPPWQGGYPRTEHGAWPIAPEAIR